METYKRGIADLEYKSYYGSIEHDADDSLVGKVLDMNKNLILYEGDTIEELQADCEAGIESYFESCEELCIAPHKPVNHLVDEIVKEALLQVTYSTSNFDKNRRGKMGYNLPTKQKKKFVVA